MRAVEPAVSAPRPQRPPSGGGLRGAFASLSVREFRWLLAGNSTFFMAVGGQMLVRPFIAYELTDSPLALGIVSVSMAIPMLFVSPLGGAFADRFERRRLILVAQTAAVLGESSVLALLLLGVLEYWHLVVATILIGSSFPISMPARQAIVINLVGKAGLGNAAALNIGVQNVTRVVGPALAGFLIPWIGIEGVYALDIGLYLLAMVAMIPITPMRPSGEVRAVSMTANLVGGFRYVGQNRIILLLLLYGLVPMFLAAPFQSLLVVFTEDVWHTGTPGLGTLNASIGVGGVLGSIFVATRSPTAGRQRVMLTAALSFGGLLMAAALSPSFSAAVVLVFFGHACSTAFGTLNNTAIQLLIPDSVRGRISSFLMMSFSLPMLGALPVSAAAEAFGAPIAVGVASGLALVSAVAFYALSPTLRSVDAQVAHAMRPERDVASSHTDPRAEPAAAHEGEEPACS